MVLYPSYEIFSQKFSTSKKKNEMKNSDKSTKRQNLQQKKGYKVSGQNKKKINK